MRTTDDHFLMEVDPGNQDVDQLTSLLGDTGAVEIKVIDKEEDNH